LCLAAATAELVSWLIEGKREGKKAA